MKKEVMARVLAQRQQQIDNKKLALEKEKAMSFLIPEIQNTHKEYINTMFAEKMQSNFDSEKTNLALSRYIEALMANGYDENSFSYTPNCKICNDKGSVDNKVCRCLWKVYIDQLKVACNVQKIPFKFSDADFSLFSNTKTSEYIQKVYNSLKTYVDRYPNINTKNWILLGTTGTGKTCLGQAIINRAVDRGFDALVCSAYEFNSKMLEIHTSPIRDRTEMLDRVMNVDFLFIDDLGTEPMLRNVTNEYLLLVLEERTKNGRATIITTNMTADFIANKYRERIYSRLFDKRNSKALYFSGTDLRK